MIEIWKPLRKYENIYEISNYGRILKISTQNILKSRHNKNGYLQINLSKNGIKKTYAVHRLVMETFNPVSNMELLQVNHINEKKDDNRITNLEWTTAKENINYGNHNCKISSYRRNNSGNGKKEIICLSTGKIFKSISEAARYYNIKNKSNITHCALGIANYCGTLVDGTKLKWMYY